MYRDIGVNPVNLTKPLDDYSRYIIAWKLCTNMTADDVTATLKLALEASGGNRANVVHKPRRAPYHPQTQGKIERWHQTLKNRILLENYIYPAISKTTSAPPSIRAASGPTRRFSPSLRGRPTTRMCWTTSGN